MQTSNHQDIMKHKIGYENRIENISYEDARNRVLDRLEFIKTEENMGMFWTKKTKSINFLNEEGKVVAIYNKTIRDFWWVFLEWKWI